MRGSAYLHEINNDLQQMIHRKIFLLILTLVSLAAHAQDWNKKQCAVVLTYDDALNVHLDHAVPALDSLNLKGTFYLTASSPAFTRRMLEWKKVSRKHELGNHTLFHPCAGNRPGRSFVTPEYDLATYTVRRMIDELRMTNSVLEAIDGKKQRTFAYPCGDTRIGDTAYLNNMKSEFVSARGVQTEMLQKQNIKDLYNIGCYVVNGQTGEELVAIVQKAMETNSMVVFLFHGVGGEHGLNVSLEAHSRLLRFMKDNKKKIWNPTFLEASLYIKKTAK
jgi:sialate O-acetylesterase